MFQLVVAAVKYGQTGQVSDGGRQTSDLILSNTEVGQVDQVAQLKVDLLDAVEPELTNQNSVIFVLTNQNSVYYQSELT